MTDLPPPADDRPSRPDVAAILATLEGAGVRFVLTGSVAATAYGVKLDPGDLDIAPDLEADNLAALAGLLATWNAKPVFVPEWPGSPSEAECARWTPDPPTPGRLDRLLTTPYGRFDIVPWRSGWYLDLVRRATVRTVAGVSVPVAHPKDLLATLNPTAEKHRTRRVLLESVVERMDAQRATYPRKGRRSRQARRASRVTSTLFAMAREIGHEAFACAARSWYAPSSIPGTAAAASRCIRVTDQPPSACSNEHVALTSTPSG
jgi:hypothetical protein